jgi:hypothetical protein
LKSIRCSGLKIIAILVLGSFFPLVVLAGLPGCRTTEKDPVEEKQVQEILEPEESVEEEPEEDIDIIEDDIIEEDIISDEEDIISDNINMLSGLELTDSVQNYRPLAIMVQNSPKARPHSGLIYADMVFEAVAEYGVTRYVALFSSSDVDILGPVRSARIYFAEIARSFNPIYTFWGTYPEGYTAIKNMDMDVLDANSAAYVPHTSAGWRDHSRSDALEHTAFIDTYGIKEDAAKYGYSLEGGQSPMAFKIDAPDPQRGNISEITVDFSSSTYITGFSYDKNTNKYLKSLAGSPHIDFESGQQLSLNNIIVIITDIDGPLSNAGHMMIRTTGSHDQGAAYYFMDGNVIEGTWGRDSIFDPFEFKDSNSQPILFNRGSTWVCIIQGIDRLTY